MRFGKISKEDIVRSGDFLNYGITWDPAEHAFDSLQKEGGFDALSAVFEGEDKLIASVQSIIKEM